MINNFFNISVVYFLILLTLKEYFSNDGEKVVILCILSFILLAYFNLRTSLHENFLLKTNKLEEEYKQLADFKVNLETNIKKFWILFNKLGNYLVEIFLNTKFETQVFIKKAYKSRNLLNINVNKDQLDAFFKDNFLIKYFSEEINIKQKINKNNLILELKINFNSNDLFLESNFVNIKNKIISNFYNFVSLNFFITLKK